MQDGNTIEQTGMLRRLSPAHFRKLVGLCDHLRDIPARVAVSTAGEEIGVSLLLLDGLMGRHISDRDNRRRRLVALEVPGDFVDLHSMPLGRLDHDVTAMSDVRLAVFKHDVLKDLVRTDPEMAIALWGLTLVDAAIHRHWAYRVSAMRAMERLANFICEMEDRLALCGRADAESYALPLTQADLGDASGMTAVHVNRGLRDLREAGCCTISQGRVTIHNREKLQQIGYYQPDFLYLHDIPEGEDPAAPGRAIART
ncbi:Crp/Fnr family transcriptional regulator [Jannaschia sp. M317]|uniref:Crp/Fnr family transcriptional regulator n=1 Tax=Jannaschia sp. M317 TaxID=2867011 RepID=UPI0021A4182B|nr:Crp/Fnr family transcriptional regulator [Jannaschia sp. M317]UWQ17952.1 Crp/Fnr family transcriptional regulator [Jannaschia sp. M317]